MKNSWTTYLRYVFNLEARQLSAAERSEVNRRVSHQQELISRGVVIAIGLPLAVWIFAAHEWNAPIRQIRLLTQAQAILGVAFAVFLVASTRAREARLSWSLKPLIAAYGLLWSGVLAYYVRATQARLDSLLADFDTFPTLFGMTRGRMIGDAVAEADRAGVVFLCVSILFLARSPLRTRLLALQGAVQIAICFYVFSTRQNAADWIAFGTPAMLAAITWAVVNEHRIERDVLIDLEFQRLTERAAVLAYERELDVARSIQRSMLPPSLRRFHNRISIQTYQSMHNKVGGDWFAFREVAGETIVLVVAEVRGKGLQAALVAHAIQSLWAESLDRPEFSPPAFIARVHQVLRLLGKGAPHEATMGIASIEGRTLTYWSAAHGPLHMTWTSEDGDREQSSLAATGSALGKDGDLALESVTRQIPAGMQCDILLGNDGVFDLFQQDAALLSTFALALRRNGISVLEQMVADDKTLIWASVDR